MAKIFYIGSTTYTEKYKSISTLKEFLTWFSKQKIVGHDIETNKVDCILDRELRVLQFADEKGESIWIIQGSFLTEKEQITLAQTIQNFKGELIVFTNFEYIIWKKYGITLNKLYDAFSAEKVLTTGYTVEKGYYSLAGTYKRRFDIDMSKALQCEFSDDVLTDDKIEYAALDVYKLGHLRSLQLTEAETIDKQIGLKLRNPKVKKIKDTYSKGLITTIWWENEFSKVLGDIEFHGINFDREKWIDNYNKALPIVQESKKELNTIILNFFGKKFLVSEDLYVDKDRMEPIWNSSVKKLQVLSWLFPNLPGTSKVVLKDYLKTNDPDFPEGLKVSGKAWEASEYRQSYDTNFAIIKFIINRDKNNQDQFDEALDNTFIAEFRDKLIEEELLIPANTMIINWNSPIQRLKVFQKANPKIENTAEQTVLDNWHTHEIFPIYHKFTKSNSLITKFGLKYLDHINIDGRIRTRFNPIINTGRISAKEPNLLQIPKKQAYRDAFIASQGWKFVGADYASEEILIIALLSKDPVWLKSFKDGDDVHSVNASLIFGDKWIEAIEEGCVFEFSKQKCSCKRHQDMRDKSKAISFGLSYGLSAHGASIRLQITMEEAKVLINKFFSTFPTIKNTLASYANFGVHKGFIVEPTLGRVRFYDQWKIEVIKKLERYNKGLIQDMNYSEIKEAEKQKSSIERESKNMPIQGSGAGIVKISGVLLRRYINNNNLQDKIRLLLFPYDEWCTESVEKLSEEWAKTLQHYMEFAGKLALNTDLLKAEPYIDNHWVK